MLHRKIQCIIILLMLLSSFLIMHISPVTGQFGPNTVVIEPREPSGGVAPYAVIPGQQVTINITIHNAVNIYGYNLTIFFGDPSLLEFVGFRYMPFLDEPYTTKDVHPTAGKITVYAKSEPPAEPVNGTGTLISLIFNATKVGETLIRFDAANSWIIMEDGSQKHPDSFKSGKLAVTNTKIAVEPEELSGSVGETVKANITVYNVVDLYGIQINVTWNPEILQLTQVQYQVPWKNSFEIRNLTGPGWYALIVAGLTQPPDPYTGNYTFVSITYKVLKIGTTKIKFETSKLSDINANPILHAEINAIFSNIKIIEGDINHDGIVDVQDLIIVCSAYGSNPNKPNWNPNADLNNDNTIDIYDLIIVASHYGQTNP